MDVIFERHESLPIASGSVPLSIILKSSRKKQDAAPVPQSNESQRHTNAPIEIEFTSPARPETILGSRR
jgi:hypothetical protein